MKQLLKKVTTVLVLIVVILFLAACGERMNPEEIEKMKIEQTIGNYLDGYAKNNSTQIIETLYLEESKKEDLQIILDQFLQVFHRNPYTFKISYQIEDNLIEGDFAVIDLSAVLRIYDEEDIELFSVRLFKDKELILVKDSDGEWKIDVKQFIPEELLKLDFIF
ncbi:hypothetical protein BBF96_15575 [Anoxybacter fermentans]|uniref:DUF4829 domain-containing protein n=1 Tax=Anoxybacter fermentans TaxID=1323375 RepID=A0A3Q9HT19_9FIRM|nr:hypothetical protein [Anoxybacter fermentans]AZR74667.1 hypothetical protein BBF96_15575 [Anoxybacter fermentans]